MLMSATSYPHHGQAPPVRPSRSLEGLEQVIPPRVARPPARPPPTLQLDKPLPDLPASKDLPETPLATAWSDDSTIDSFESHRQSTDSTESYPVFVRSASDDLTELVDHAPISSLDRATPVDPYKKQSITSTLALNPTFSIEDPYGGQPDWGQKRAGPNHYFREKKWDFFPELAPSVLQAETKRRPQTRKKDAGILHFDFGKNRSRWNSFDRGGLSLAHEVRDSIRSYVHRTLSRNSVEKEQSKRPVTAPSCYPRKYATSQVTEVSSDHSYGGTSGDPPKSSDISYGMRTLSIMSIDSSMSEEWESPPPIPTQRKKQLAVPMTPYQRYGTAIWDKSRGAKRKSYQRNHRVRFPKYNKQKPQSPASEKSKPELVTSNPTTPLTPPVLSQLQQNTRVCVKALQDRTTYVLVAIDGAKKKMIKARIDRRRKQLKAQIRLVGPVNPYTTYGRVDPWDIDMTDSWF